MTEEEAAGLPPQGRWGAPLSRRRERGSGTVLLTGVVALLLALTVGALGVVSAVVAAHRAQAAADLASLAAAGALVRGEPPAAVCSAAGRLASVNGGVVSACRLQADRGAELTVEVTVVVTASMPGIGVASARARAGPGPGGP